MCNNVTEMYEIKIGAKNMSKKKMSVEYDLFTDFGTVDEGNIVAGAVMQAVEETQNREPEKKSAEHEKICTRLIAI